MLKKEITEQEIKTVFCNKDNKTAYLQGLFAATGNSSPIETTKAKTDQQIIKTWSYDISKTVIRELFIKSPKYAQQRDCGKKIDEAIQQWKKLGLGDLEWPFSAMAFDQYVHTLNRRDDCSEFKKDAILSRAATKFRRMKQINSLRNDYIEYLIFQNENVIPTFGNSKGVDFYINGEPYDQKVGKTVGSAFIQTYGDRYRETAIKHPELVAKSFYENQDEARFGKEPRLMIAYLDGDISSQRIREQLAEINFDKPYEIQFRYKHANGNTEYYETKCFVILLHN